MEFPAAFRDDRYNREQSLQAEGMKQMSQSYVESSEDEIFFGPMTPKESTKDAILRGLRRTQHLFTGSPVNAQYKNSPRGMTATTGSPRIQSKKASIPDLLTGSIHEDESQEPYSADSPNSLRTAMTMLTVVADDETSITGVPVPKPQDVSVMSNSILSESQMSSPFETHFGKELQNKPYFSPIIEQLPLAGKEKPATPRISRDSLDVVEEKENLDGDKENTDSEKKKMIYRSSFHFAIDVKEKDYIGNESFQGLVPPCSPVDGHMSDNEWSDVTDDADEIEPQAANMEIEEVMVELITKPDKASKDVEIVQTSTEQDGRRRSPSGRQTDKEDVLTSSVSKFTATVPQYVGNLEPEEGHRSQIEASHCDIVEELLEIEEDEKSLSYYSTVSNIEKLTPKKVRGECGLKEEKKVDRKCRIVDVLEKKGHLKLVGEKKPVSPRCSPTIAKLAMPKRVTPKKQMEARATPNKEHVKQKLFSPKPSPIVGQSHVAKYIKNNDFVTPLVKQIRANDRRSVSKIQKRFASKLPVPKARNSYQKKEVKEECREEEVDNTTEEEVLEEMQQMWDKYDSTFDRDEQSRIMARIQFLKEKFVKMTTRKDSLLPAVECSYVLPEASYTASSALTLDEKNWDVVTKMHTVQNMQPKRGFPAVPLQPTIFKHTGNRKRIKWVPGLATATTKKCSPSNIQGVAPPILMSRNPECYNAFMDASSLEASVVFQVQPPAFKNANTK